MARLLIGFSEDLLIEAPIAPEALASRLRSRLGQKPRRAFGVLKVTDEWVGAVQGNEFTVWERRNHAIRARGRIRGVRGGSRVEARVALQRRSAVMLVIFLAVFAVGAIGILTQPRGLGISPGTLVLVVGAGVTTLLVFWVASLRQRAALRAFLADVFRASP